MTKNDRSLFSNTSLNKDTVSDKNWGWYGELRRQTQTTLDKDKKVIAAKSNKSPKTW